jgi:hypothetical protein
MVKRLLDNGAQAGANLVQTVARHPLPLSPEAIRTMIARGADAKRVTPDGLTMIELGRRNGNTTLVEALGGLGLRDDDPAARVLEAKPAETARAAVERSLPLLQRADKAFLDRAGCVSCHNNSLTAMTVAASRAKGLRVNETVAKDQLRRIAAFLQENAELALEGLGVPGAHDTASYTLLGMAAEHYQSDAITDVWARFVKNTQSVDGVWRVLALRPPLESSDFEVTAASIRVLRTYGPKAQRAEYNEAAARGVAWLARAQPLSTEDYAFRVLGLVWGGGNRAAVAKAAGELAAIQREDGGWGQVPGLASDAYATGQALTALRESGAAATGAAYQKGVRFLIGSQLADGSWYVRTRTIGIQPYFDSDFSHGKDQFISAAATNWAAMALLGAVR